MEISKFDKTQSSCPFRLEHSSHLSYLLEHPSAGSSFLASGPANFFYSYQFQHYSYFSHSFILSVSFTRFILLHTHISIASSCFCPFSRSIEVSEPYKATLRTTHFTSLFLWHFSKGPQKMLLFLLKASFYHCYPLLYFLTAVHVATDITPQVFEAVHLFNGFPFNPYIYLLWLSSDNHGLRFTYIYLHPIILSSFI